MACKDCENNQFLHPVQKVVPFGSEDMPRWMDFNYCPSCGEALKERVDETIAFFTRWYAEHNRPAVVAVDFDGTLCVNAWPEIGEPKWVVINQLKELQAADLVKLVLWTCRHDGLLEAARTWCDEKGLYFTAYNESDPCWMELFGGDPRKVGADFYLDDKALTITDFLGGVG